MEPVSNLTAEVAEAVNVLLSLSHGDLNLVAKIESMLRNELLSAIDKTIAVKEKDIAVLKNEIEALNESAKSIMGTL